MAAVVMHRFSVLAAPSVRSQGTVLGGVFTPDFLTGKQEKNQGEISMIVVENAHEAIIDPEVFEKVQEKKGHSASKQ